MYNISISEYKDLLCHLDNKIMEHTLKFCNSETFGYKACKDKLKKLIALKSVLKNNFFSKKLSNIFYSCIKSEDGNVQTIKTFNKKVGNKAELLVRVITKSLDTSRSFSFILPSLPNIEGFYIYGFWINCKLEVEADWIKVMSILEDMEFMSFYGFTLNLLTGEITSTTSYKFDTSYSYELVDINLFNTLDCVDLKKLKTNIENV